MRHDAKYWQHETIANYDVAMELAGQIAAREGLITYTKPWALRLSEIYRETRARLEVEEADIAATA